MAMSDLPAKLAAAATLYLKPRPDGLYLPADLREDMQERPLPAQWHHKCCGRIAEVTYFPPQSGPCVICGDTNYGLSCGGPTICPKCDCGHFDAATVMQQQKVIAALRQERDDLLKANQISQALIGNRDAEVDRLRIALEDLINFADCDIGDGNDALDVARAALALPQAEGKT